ncbi:MAG: lipoate--protein ligase A [Pirellulaceae bacterium]|nr:MAG: lipoate--protein ligase A [Pirellulaceae bacterium]
MKYLDLTLATVAENLALEEAILQQCENGTLGAEEWVRVWDAHQPFVVIGRSSRLAEEVDLAAAAQMKAPVFRRISGGASIAAGPGCFFYAVFLSLHRRPHLRMIDQAHRFVMEKIAAAVRQLGVEPRVDGHCDLVVGDRKVSGNALRIQRNWLLYHGTLLLSMDLTLIEQLLRHPPREPGYRRGRPHREFLANLGLGRQELAAALCRQWQAEPVQQFSVPQVAVTRLVTTRYNNPRWNAAR